MVKGHYPRYAKVIYKREHIKLQIEDGDLELLAAYPLDFIGFSYYLSAIVKAGDDMNTTNRHPNPECKATPWGMSIDPLGLRYCLNDLADQYDVPLFIVENGMGNIDTLGNGKIHIHTEFPIYESISNRFVMQL